MRGQARPGRAAHEKCSRVLELAGASMAGDVEEGLSDPAQFSRRRMRSEGLHAVEGVEVSGGCSTDFSEISTFLARST